VQLNIQNLLLEDCFLSGVHTRERRWYLPGLEGFQVLLHEAVHRPFFHGFSRIGLERQPIGGLVGNEELALDGQCSQQVSLPKEIKTCVSPIALGRKEGGRLHWMGVIPCVAMPCTVLH
jgi:hypothetical protein